MKKSEQCTSGLVRTIALFEAALIEIMQSDEIDKLIKHTRGQDRAFLKILKEAMADAVDRLGVTCINIWGFLPALQKAPHLLADVVSYMVANDDIVVEGEELDAIFGE